MNTVEQSGTGFDVLFWYVLRGKEKERQGCMADFKFFEKPRPLSMITKHGW